MKKNKLFYKAMLVFLMSSLASTFFLYKEKSKVANLNIKSTQLAREQAQRLQQLRAAYDLKYSFIEKSFLSVNLKTNSKQEIISSFKSTLTYLENFKIINQTDFDNFEAKNNFLNQIVIKEVIAFNQKKLSLIKTIDQIRALERFDRHIDVTRADYSRWSYQYYSFKKETDKSVFNKKTPDQVLFYKLDHLILEKNSLKEISKSASL